MPKTKIADHADWDRIVAARHVTVAKSDGDFAGTLFLWHVDEVAEPMFSNYPDRVPFCVLDAGHVWLRCFPSTPHHIQTFMFDEHGALSQLWIDLCVDHGVGADGIPWWNDLYLDLIVLADGELLVDDEDELADALEAGRITQAQFDGAHAEADRLRDDLAHSWQQRFARATRWYADLLPRLS